MAFTAITSAQVAQFECPKNTAVASVTPIALDMVNGNTIPYDTNMAMVIQETGGTNPGTVEIASLTDTNGFSSTQTIAVAANGTAIVPPLSNLFSEGGLIKLTTSGTGALSLILVRYIA